MTDLLLKLAGQHRYLEATILAMICTLAMKLGGAMGVFDAQWGYIVPNQPYGGACVCLSARSRRLSRSLDRHLMCFPVWDMSVRMRALCTHAQLSAAADTLV